MTVEELLVFGKEYVHSDIAKIILAEFIDKNSLELLNYLDLVVDDNIVEKYKKAVISFKNKEPLQYVLGSVNFYGNRFKVDKRVLIPRFETEELVENTIEYIKKYFKEPVDIIDLGCGSGVIGLTLEKKVSTKSVDLVDISKDALDVAYENAKSLKSNANLIESDFFQKINKKYDIIISNPPYISKNETIEQIVKENEPEIALYADNNGLSAYEEILKNIAPHMKDKCLIAFEIGYLQKEAITNLINKYLENVHIIVKKDLSEKDRMVFIFKNIV